MAQGETMPVLEQDVVFTIGEGAINPVTRVKTGELEQNSLSQAAERLKTDEFYVRIDPQVIPTKCVDGRPRVNGTQELGANSAAGTFSTVMADALTTNRFRKMQEKASAHAHNVYQFWIENNYKIGGHDADHAAENGCGCGAEDVLDGVREDAPSIIRYIIQRGEDIRGFLLENGIETDDATHNLLTKNATKLYQEGYATSGKELRDTMKAVAGEESVETLTGPHLEGLLAVNTEAGTTFDRVAFAAAFDGNIQAFNVDVWSLKNAAQAMSETEKEADQKFAALLYYNVATAAVLSQNLMVVTR